MQSSEKEVRLITESIKDLGETLIKLLSKIKDLNLLCCAIREFLKSKGLKHVNQLDEAGRKELQDHLQIQKSLKKLAPVWR